MESPARASASPLPLLTRRDQCTWLPYEILSHIFQFAKPTNHAEGRRWAVSVPNVCKRWRDISLDCPFLWTNISLRWSHPLALIFLERSAGLPLNVDLDLERMPYSNLLLLQQHFPRVRSLVVYGDPCWGYPVSEMFKHYTPAEGSAVLEELVVEAVTFGFYELPLARLCGQSPRLRRICLSPTIPAAPTLPFIDDSAESLHLTVALPIIHIIPVLQRMRRLRSFTYTRRAAHNANMSSIGHGVDSAICLPHIEHLSLNNTPCSEAVELLYNLDAPRLTSAHVHIVRNVQDRADTFGGHFVSALKRGARAVSDHTLLCHEQTAILSATTSSFSVQLLPRHEPLGGSIAPIIHIVDETSRLPFVWDTCNVFAKDGSIRTLRLDNCVGVLDRCQWRVYLSAPIFDGVETVEVRHSEERDLDGFIDAISSRPSSCRPQTILPSLRQVISIDGRNITTRHDFNLSP